MGRPPNTIHVNTPHPPHPPPPPHHRPWSAPMAQTAGSILRNTVSQHSNKVRQYLLPLPPIPEPVRQAIVSSIQSFQQQEPFHTQQNRIRALTNKLHDQRERCNNCQEKVILLEQQKESNLHDICTRKQQESEIKIQSLERKWKYRYQKEDAIAQEQFQRTLQKECDTQRNIWLQEWEETEEKRSMEPTRKRLKLLEQAAQAAATTTITTTNTSGTTTTSSTNTENHATTTATTLTSTPIDGGDGTTNTTVTSQSQHDTEPDAIAALIEPAVAAVPITSDKIQIEVETKTAQLEELEQSRRGMISLLKEVIKAEGKQKAKSMALENAKNNSSTNRSA